MVLDVVDVLKTPKRSLITFPTLLPAKEPKKTGGKPEGEEEAAAAAAAASDAETQPTTPRQRKQIKELDFDTVKVTVKPYNPNTVSLEGERLAWVSIPEHPIHVLECPAFRIILLEENCPDGDPNCFTAIWTSRRKETEDGFDGFKGSSDAAHAYRGTIGETKMKLVDIMPLVDDFIAQYEASTGKSITSALLTKAFWRRSSPPTPKQLAILLKASEKCNASPAETSAIFSATKGRAAACITRLNFLKSLKTKPSLTWRDIF